MLQDRFSKWQFSVYGFLGFLLLGFTLIYQFVIPLTPGRVGRASFALIEGWGVWRGVAMMLPPVPTEPLGVLFLLLLLVVLGGGAYGTAVYLGWQQTNPRLLAFVIGTGLALNGLAVLAFPNVNTDVFNYMVNGRLAAVYNQNPYFVAADTFPDDPIYPYASRNYTRNPEDKLFVWAAINIALAYVGGDDPVTNLLLYRLAFFLFNSLNIALIAYLLSRFNPAHQLAGVTFYAWNPIVLAFGQGKTDVVMVFFLLLAVWLWQNGRFFLTPLSLLASVLVKLMTAPLLAVYVLGELRTERRWYWVGGGLTAVVVAALAYWRLPAVQQIAAWYAAILWAKDEPFGSLLAQGGLLVLVGGVGLFYATDFAKTLHGWGWVLVYFALFLARFSFSWYLLTLIAVTALVPNRWLVRVMWLLSLLSLALNVWGAAFTAVFPHPFS